MYVADAGALALDAFERGEHPRARVASASAMTSSGAVLEGVLNGGGGGTTGYYFQYAPGETCTGWRGDRDEPGTSGVVHAAVSGLSPSTSYTVCLVATNEFGSSTGARAVFESGGVAPVVVEGSQGFSQVGSRSATLSAQVETENQPAGYYFLYGPSATFASEPAQTSQVSLPTSAGAVAVSAQLTGLEPLTRIRVPGRRRERYGPRGRAGAELQHAPGRNHGATRQPRI